MWEILGQLNHQFKNTREEKKHLKRCLNLYLTCKYFYRGNFIVKHI